MGYGRNVAQGQNIIAITQKAVSKKDPADYEVWEKALMAAGEDKCDWTDKKYIEPIIAYLGK